MITLNDITLMRGSKVLIEHTFAQISDGHKVGIIGRNGCGKSSLFAAILGDLAPELGSIGVPKNIKIAYVEQQTPALDISALDYVMQGDKEVMRLFEDKKIALENGNGEKAALIEDELGIAGAWTLKPRSEELLHGLGFSQEEIFHAVKEFSGGWRMRLNLARALILNSDLLLLDEPTNHLDLDTVLFLESYLKSYKGTILCISHDRDFLDCFCTDILHFESGKIVMYTGNYSDYERLRAERIKAEKASRKKEEAILSHMQAFVDRFRYKATKAKQAQSLIKAINRMQLTAVTQEESPFSFSFPEPERTPAVIASFDKVNAGYNEQAPVLKNINLSILSGDRIGLLGRNGQGKSTLIKTLCSAISPLTGTVTLGKGIKIGYFAQQELESLDPNLTALEHLQRIDPNAREKDLRSFLGSFAFSGDKATAKVSTMSGGEQARLALSIIAFEKPNLLLLDEPTNHLDLEMREALSIALASYPGALVLVSHDRHLLEAIADKLWLVDNHKVSEFSGDLDDYKNYLDEQRKLLNHNESASKINITLSNKSFKSKEDKRKEANIRALLRPLKQKIEKIERELEQIKNRMAEIESILADSSIYNVEHKAELENLLKERGTLISNQEELEVNYLLELENLENKEKELHAC